MKEPLILKLQKVFVALQSLRNSYPLILKMKTIKGILYDNNARCISRIMVKKNETFNAFELKRK